jgi:hypothetical protein
MSTHDSPREPEIEEQSYSGNYNPDSPKVLSEKVRFRLNSHFFEELTD